MSELDEQMREAQDITEVLANPLNPSGGEDADLDAELDLLEAVDLGAAPSVEPARKTADSAAREDSSPCDRVVVLASA
jgi:hypothetical protein